MSSFFIPLIDTTFASFVPVNNEEFAATTANNYLRSYKNGQSVWVKILDGQQGLSKLINVGNIYLVVANSTDGIDLYRKSDGLKYRVLSKTGEQFTAENLNVVSSRFMANNKILLSYTNGVTGKSGKIIIDLDKKIVTKTQTDAYIMP